MSSSNASASAFGWDFQSNAAIVLMLQNIKSSTSAKVEGKTEDIEIKLDNGETIYSQAKSVFNPEDTSNVISKLEAGLRTLNEASKKDDMHQLVFITNSPNPFNNQRTMYAFSSSINELNYYSLPESCKTKIDKICSENNYDSIKRDKLNILVMQFRGDERTRYQVVKDFTNEFLANLGLGDRGLGKSILSHWQSSFFHNASHHDIAKKITKKEMVWPIIVSICNVDLSDAILADCDEAYFNEIVSKYKSIIDTNSERFDFITKVMSHYGSFEKHLNFKDRQKKFISNEWSHFKEDFLFESVDDFTVERVIKLTLSNIIKSRMQISRIKERVNLS